MSTIYFVAGEASGDNHGAALMTSLRSLQPDMAFAGRGGPQMKAIAGAALRDWIGDAGVVGFSDVVQKYGYFRKQFRAALSEIVEQKPDAVVLIDYPGFNLRLARALHRGRLAKKLIYYISPQVWAWNRGRIKQMARYLDLMLCIFPFEAGLYNKSGLHTKFVGHPMIDRLATHKVDRPRDPDLIGLFPGSRRREVDKILPLLRETAEFLRAAKPNLRFEISAVSDELASVIREMWHRHEGEGIPASIQTGDATGLMQRAVAGIVASGSATLEAAYFRLPFVLIYKVSWLTYLMARPFVKVNYLGMPNVLADRAVIPEFIQHRARPRAIADAVLRLIDDAVARERMIFELDKVIHSLGEGGASLHAAQAVIDELRATA